MPNLRAEASMHARQGQTPEALGARDVLDKMQARLDHMPEAMTIRRQTVEHPFGTLKAWMGSTHFLTRTLEKVKTEMSLQVLAYNMKRMINIFGVNPLMQAIAA
jgi:Transposase DDE domain